ncbi:hypothetical protein [Novosphingobium sp. 9]|uniref:hypothetical protein n=1 Tax=Novosphingobium sp. 9 TaxID=2025349 RepID=UPI0021B5F512|nr:hypothetical protein [Novosphingobium sp. 9]
MRRIAITALSATALIAAAAGITLSTAAFAAKPKLSPDEQIAKIVGKRVPGKPVNCINLPQIDSTQIVDKTAIVYKDGSTYYVNRPHNADTLREDDILVTKTFSSQLCRLDTVQLHDRATPSMWRGFVSLNDFVPYRLPPKK